MPHQTTGRGARQDLLDIRDGVRENALFASRRTGSQKESSMKATIAMTVLACLAVTLGVAAKDAGAPVAMTPENLKWTPNPDAKGVETSVVWGDAAKGAHAAFHKFEPGFSAPLHTHTSNNRIVVLRGTMAMASEDGTETKLPAGSFFTQPRTHKHTTKCLPGAECLIYVEADGKWSIEWVEEKEK
jgi:quercetin dioxygenase-like cupin family protein